MRAAIVLACALAVSALALERLPVPFVWVAAAWLGALVALCISARRRSRRLLWLHLAAVVLALGAAELLLWLRAPEWFEGSFPRGYSVEHDLLGYAPVQGARARAVKHAGGERIYDVTYTIDAEGLRRAPPADDARGSVLFFGGSVTFGEGVEDEEAMPYRVALERGGRLRSYNFGFHGYGPHQMLAALEQGRVERIVEPPLIAAVYQALPAHVARAAGLARWDDHGPRYVLDERGRAVRAGRFDDDSPAPVRWARDRLGHSLLFQRLAPPTREVTEADVALFLAIVERSREITRARFEGADFHVLLWGWPGEPRFDALHAGLTGRGLRVHPIGDVLPGYLDDPAAFELHPRDPHPNARAHRHIAAYVAGEILAESVAATGR